MTAVHELSSPLCLDLPKEMFPPNELAQIVMLDYKVVIITISTTIYYVLLQDNTVSCSDC